MFDKMYLLNAEISGVKNIDKKVNLSFYKQTIDKSFDMTNYRVKAIFGENGCGKTALITAFNIMENLVFIEGYNTINRELLENIINKRTKRFSFSCDFIASEKNNYTVYRYSISLNHDINGYYIDMEQLSKRNGNYVNNNFKDVYLVEEGELKFLNTDEDEKNYIHDKSLNILRNQSFLKTLLSIVGKDISAKEYIYDVLYLLFFMVSIGVYIGDTDKHDIYMLYNEIGNKLSLNGKVEPDYISDIFSQMTGVSDERVKIELFDNYQKKIDRMALFIKLFKPDLERIQIRKIKDVDYYNCRLIFDYGKYSVDKEFESTGIKKLISVFDAIDLACHGGIVFIDEFDANINAIYLEKIVEYIIIYGNGQLCFTTHGLEIMDLLKSEKLAIDFLTMDKEIIHWTAKGNNSPINYYKKGFIKGIPYNIDSIDFMDVFMENNE